MYTFFLNRTSYSCIFLSLFKLFGQSSQQSPSGISSPQTSFQGFQSLWSYLDLGIGCKLGSFASFLVHIFNRTVCAYLYKIIFINKFVPSYFFPALAVFAVFDFSLDFNQHSQRNFFCQCWLQHKGRDEKKGYDELNETHKTSCGID